MHSLSWDNLRYVLSVIDAGSVSGAARALGVNHATVLRRIAAFEAQHGGAIFDKSASGYRLMHGKERLVKAFREVESSVQTVERLMQGANPQLSGVVRISSTDTICQFLLTGMLEALRKQAPQLQVELLSNNSHLNFARMEADLFVRPAVSVPEDSIAEKATNLVFRAYARSERSRQWYSLSGPLARSAAAQWLTAHVPASDLMSGSDSFVVLSQMAQSGDGIAILPSFVGDRIPELMCLTGLMPDIQVPIWVGTHQDLRDIPRINAVKKTVITHLAKNSP